MDKKKKAKFTQDEDIRLLELVHMYGDNQWTLVSNGLKNRSVRQCRERWRNYLSPCVRNDPWGPDEDRLLLTKYQEFGPKWTKIAMYFTGRTDINIKNRYTTISRHQQAFPQSQTKNIIMQPPSMQMMIPAVPPTMSIPIQQQEIMQQQSTYPKVTKIGESLFDVSDSIDLKPDLDFFMNVPDSFADDWGFTY